MSFISVIKQCFRDRFPKRPDQLDIVFGCLWRIHPRDAEGEKRPCSSRLGAISNLGWIRGQRFSLSGRASRRIQCTPNALSSLKVRALGSATRRHWRGNGNKDLASVTLLDASESGDSMARRAFIYKAERVIQAFWKVVRDTGFEPVTPTVSM